MSFQSFCLHLICILFTCDNLIASFHPVRKIAVLDVTIRNAETDDAEIFSAKHVVKVSGLPYLVTPSIDTAKKYSVILLTGKTETFTFNQAEKDSLIAYVNRGGILIAPQVRDNYFNSLYGINGGVNANNHYRLIFNTFLNDPAFRWLDDSLEQTISLGSQTFTSVINTRYYNLNGALSLAKYNNNTAAITRNQYGSGFAYALGFSFKNLFLVNQQNRDYNANRSYSNDFEPTSDAIILFLRGAVLSHVPRSVYLHTSPFNSKSAVLITHDVDATSAFDSMSYYADYETQMGINASYYITTHYINDGALADFYNVFTIPKVQYLLNKGHVLGSHSVGHFTDFDNETVFPLGALGNTAGNYLPYNAGNNNATTGGSVLGETEVSKNLLSNNFGVNIKTFRAGYLCFNDRLINALDTLGYAYNTTFSACDVLTNFPYRNKKNRVSAGAVSKVWEFPMTISDVFSSDPISPANYNQKVLKWLDVTQRNKNNNAPTVLLIHPNRLYKLAAQQNYITGLTEGIYVTSLETFAGYWLARDTVEFSSALKNDSLTITIPVRCLPLPNTISFIVEKGQLLSNIKLKDSNGNSLGFLSSNWESNDKILYLQNHPVVSVDENYVINKRGISLFPNPCYASSVVQLDKSYRLIECYIYDLNGKLVEQQCSSETNFHQLVNNHRQGLFFIKIVADGERKGELKVVFR